ncbi:site-specific integrase [Bradyrhizobium diazoefficiens]|uniref:site-specific integrase n=1 Tax=Bradyrhizobium diazoefficiens TaxID=1355477 RepID=UPI002729F9A5|nr:site-specific integrase [Bradyrhizobium diazoefficiens]WLA74779.1 site-specific integrase [Bradyrhizobium diazoefficiens]
MRVLMGVVKDRHGTWCARKTVPEKPKGLQAAVARELNNGKPVQKHLKRSLGTKDLREANIRAKPVLAEFDRIIAKAKASLKSTSVPTLKRTSLNDTEIKRMAEYVYAKALAWDERVRFGGRDEAKRIEAEVIRLEGAIEPPRIPHEQWPQRGVPRQVYEENKAELVDTLRELRQAAAMGDIASVQDHVLEAMWAFNVELDEHSAAYIKLSTACLHSYLRALEDIQKRDAGITVETPPAALPHAAAASIADGRTLQDALDGWKRHRARPKRTVDEFSRSVEMFIQLHGNMPVASIKKAHALEYRRALQDVPRHRTGDLLRATLPAQANWGREHPEEPRITAATINKQLGGVQSICIWANDNGVVPDDIQWTDPFSRLRLPEERSERTSFDVAELRLLFSTPLFTEHSFPLGAHGAAGFWLPVLALFSGARQAELGSLTAANVQTDAETAVALLYFMTERARGKRVKTDASERVVPVHPEAIRLGFLDYVEERRKADGPDAWLFPSVSPDRGRAGVPAWSQWFGRYLRASGVTNRAKVFHSFRHTVKDALRRGKADHEMREALIGHAQASSVSWGYGAPAMLARFGAAALADAVNRITYPGLDLSRVKPLSVPPRARGNTTAT